MSKTLDYDQFKHKLRHCGIEPRRFLSLWKQYQQGKLPDHSINVCLIDSLQENSPKDLSEDLSEDIPPILMAYANLRKIETEQRVPGKPFRKALKTKSNLSVAEQKYLALGKRLKRYSSIDSDKIVVYDQKSIHLDMIMRNFLADLMGVSPHSLLVEIRTPGGDKPVISLPGHKTITYQSLKNEISLTIFDTNSKVSLFMRILPEKNYFVVRYYYPQREKSLYTTTLDRISDYFEENNRVGVLKTLFFSMLVMAINPSLP